MSRMVLLEPKGVVSKSRARVSSRQVPKAPPQTHRVWCEFLYEFKIQIWVILSDFRKEIHGRYNRSYGIPISFLLSGTLRILELNKHCIKFILPSGHLKRLEELWRSFVLFCFSVVIVTCLFGWLVLAARSIGGILDPWPGVEFMPPWSGTWNSCCCFFSIFFQFFTILLCFMFWFFWSWGMWDLSS